MRAAKSMAGSCQIISMQQSGALKRRKIEEWIRKKILERHENDHLMDNPMVRICVMFDNMNFDAQLELCGFAKGRILGIEKDLGLRDRFLSILERGGFGDGSWEDIEEFAIQLICRENTHEKASVWCEKGNMPSGE